MIKNVQLRLSLLEESQEGSLKKRTAQYLGLGEQPFGLKILRRSIDARKPDIVFNYKLAVYINEDAPEEALDFNYKPEFD